MDDLDQRLISELRINSRSTVPQLAKLLDVAPGTVRTRLDRLIADGTIAGFTIRLRDDGSTGRIRGVMMLELTGRNPKGIIATLKKNPAFSALHTTNGFWDLIGEIDVSGLSEFHQVVTAVRTMEGVAKSESHLFLGPA